MAKRAELLVCAGAIVGLVSQQAFAQGMPPQNEYYIGDGSVDIKNGTFIYENEDIAIGPKGTDSRMAVTRVFGTRASGSGVRGPFGAYSDASFEYSINRERFLEDGNAAPKYSYRYHILIGKFVEVFQRDYGDSTIYYNGGSSGYHTLTGTFPDGPFVYTGQGGIQVTFPALSTTDGTPVGCWPMAVKTKRCAGATSVTWPSGLRYDFTYSNNYPAVIKNNFGYAIGLLYNSGQVSQACVVNLANATVSATNPCPSGSRSVYYGYTCAASCVVTTFTDVAGGIINYGYNANNGIATIRSPASTVADLSLTYLPNSQRVSQQTFSSGRVLTYTYNVGDPVPPNDPDSVYPNQWTDVAETGSGTTRHWFMDGVGGSKPSKVVDPLNHETSFSYIWGGNGASVLQNKVYPEGNSEAYAYDARANPTETRLKAKAGSGLSDIVSSAVYPTTCTSPASCDKPTSRTDPRGGVTTYTYDPTHGGILTETAPAVGGVSPVKRYGYVQRYAWISNGAGGYVQASAPTWLVSEERFCNSTTTSGSACAGGAADETVVTYDYGPNSGPNNLLPRGKVVTANGVSLRTCYAYDGFGNRISETAPRANLTSCP